MTPLLQGITGLISTAKQYINNPLTQDQDWSAYEKPAIERLKGVNLDRWRDANLTDKPSRNKRPRGSLDALI